MENGLNNMSVSEIRMVAFGDPKRNDNAFTVSSYSNSYGAQTRFITCDDKESFSKFDHGSICLLYTSPSPRDATLSRMPSSA